MSYEDKFQIIKKVVDEEGIHLYVKDKEFNTYHVEGHTQDGANRWLLKQKPMYSFPFKNEIQMKEQIDNEICST